MSRGPGRIERAIGHALRGADRSFTVEELATLVYTGVNRVEKKHRVAVLRALFSVNENSPMWFFRTHTAPWRIIVAENNVRSYVHGLLRRSWWNSERSLEQIEQILSDPEIQSVMEPGGYWWAVVEENKCEVESETFWKAAVTAGLAQQKGNGCRSMMPANMSPEMNECGDQLESIRHYRISMSADNYLIYLLGKFEPPDSPQFKYAMELRNTNQCADFAISS